MQVANRAKAKKPTARYCYMHFCCNMFVCLPLFVVSALLLTTVELQQKVK